MDNRKERGSRIVGGLIVLLIVLFVVIDYFLRRSTEFSPAKVTNILLFALQIIVLLLAIILLFVLFRNLTKLYLERKRKVVGAHFKIKLVIFFTALSFIPTLLLFLFTSNLHQPQHRAVVPAGLHPHPERHQGGGRRLLRHRPRR